MWPEPSCRRRSPRWSELDRRSSIGHPGGGGVGAGRRDRVESLYLAVRPSDEFISCAHRRVGRRRAYPRRNDGRQIFRPAGGVGGDGLVSLFRLRHRPHPDGGVELDVFSRAARLALRLFSRLQLVSASFMAFSHGANDAQKSMGIITLALVSAGVLPTAEVPTWVIGFCALAMGLGTAVGGWRIVRTLGMRIVKLEPVHGFAAETGAAVVLLATAHIGLPVSTTHTDHIHGDGRGGGETTVGGSVGCDETNSVSLALHLAGGRPSLDYLLPAPINTGVGDSCGTGR